MSDHRLPDEDLTVLVEHAAEAIATKGGHDWASLHGIAKNAIREQCLPIIFHSTKALHDLGYSKPRTITTAEELDALPEGSAVIDADEDVSTKHNGKWRGYEMNSLDSRKFAKCGPFTVLWEPK